MMPVHAPASAPPRMIPVKRRNGKLQSCEPCRLRKLSCDHRLPHCTRCVKRGTSDQCYYHPAPMTRPAATTIPSPASTSVISPSNSTPAVYPLDSTPAVVRAVNSVQHIHSSSTAARSESVPPLDRFQKILSVPSAGILFESSDRLRTVGFLGETSSTAVVAELNSSLGINAPELPNEPRSGCVSDVLVRRGVQVLLYFQDEARIKQSLDLCFSSGDTEGFHIYRPIYFAWLDGFLPVLNHALKSHALEALSAKVWRNTQRPLCLKSSTSALDWAQATTGENVRWETLGLLLTLTTVMTISLPTWHHSFGSGPEDGRTKMRDTLLDLVNMCVDFSRASESRDELLAVLLYDRFLIIAMIQGDTSTEAWTRFSEVCDMITLLGIHLENRVDAHMPFFLCELRIRLFVICFTMDKVIATFLGRPPKISYRYSVLQEPHDLHDDEMCLDEEGIRTVLASLDCGWNTSRRPTRIAWRKARFARGEVAEDILEIAIGPHCRDLERRIKQVRQRRQEIHDAMPEFARIDAETVMSKMQSDPTFRIPGRDFGWTPLDVQCIMSYHCAVRHQDFLLERAIFNRNKQDSSQLVASAKNLLTLVTKAYSLKDLCWQFKADITDTLAFFAVPPAGVLAMEIMKRDQINDPNDTFPRSETVQQLCILVSALEAVSPGEGGNYALCAMGLSAMKKVLDRLLSRPPPRPIAADNNNFDPQTQQLDHSFGVYIDNDADFLQWMDSVNFDTTPWDAMLG